MDNDALSWAPKTSLVAVGWLGTAAAAASTVFVLLASDRQGAVLLGIATLALAAASAHGTVVRPRLAADAWGLRVRTLAGTRRLDWSEVRPTVRTTRRLGRDVAVLELDTDEPAVFGWLELGADPRDVYDELVDLRPRR